MAALDHQRERAGALGHLLAQSDTQRAMDWIDAHVEHFVQELTALSEIPAPTFEEAERAAWFAERLRHIGIGDITHDSVGNVVARAGIPQGTGGVAFLAHLDTVFPSGTNVRVSRQNGRLYGPGIGDNAAGLAGLLLALEAMEVAGLQPERPLWAVASTAEEGLGDLKGARAAVERLHGNVSSVIAIEGALLGRVTHEAVGSLRWKVRFSGPGGHSWHDFGRASAINAAASAVAQLSHIPVPADPRTTYNVGRIEGGIGVNVIAAEATLLLDMRSSDAHALGDLVKQAQVTIQQAAEREGVEVELETVGDRPAGAIPRTHPLVETAADVLRQLGIEPRYEAASTDANIPLSQGIPAITVGITHGGGIHTQEEWIDIAPASAGIKQLVALAMALTRDAQTG